MEEEKKEEGRERVGGDGKWERGRREPGERGRWRIRSGMWHDRVKG